MKNGTIMTKPHNRLKRFGQFIWQVGNEFMKDHCFLRASSLAIATLLNIVPFMVLLVFLFSLLPYVDHVADEFQHFVFTNFVPSSGEAIQSHIADFSKHAKHLPLTAFLTFAITALLLMYNIERNISDIWKVKARRGISLSILMYWCMLMVGPVLLGLSSGISSYISSLHFFQGVILDGAKKLFFLLPWLSAFLAFLFLYVTVPNTKVRFRHAIAGAVTSTVLFEVAKYGIGLYVKYFPVYELLYGALAAIPIFILWLYVSWLIFLFGAEVAKCLKNEDKAQA